MTEAENFWTDEKTVDADYKVRDEQGEEIKKEPPKVNLEGKKVRDGLAQLILTVVELLRELMEKQALRRIEAGALTDEQVENMGQTFMKLKEEVGKLKEYFKLEDSDLDLNLDPLGLHLRGENLAAEDKQVSVVDILDRLLGKGVVARGDIVISVAEVDLLSVNLGLLLASIDKARELYASPATAELEEEVRKLREENERLKQQ